MGILDIFKKKDSNQQNTQEGAPVPNTPQAVTNVELINNQSMEQPTTVAPQTLQSVAPTTDNTPNIVQPIVEQSNEPVPVTVETATNNLPDNPFMEQQPVTEQPVPQPQQEIPQPTLDIFTTPPNDLKIENKIQPEPDNNISQTVVDTGALIDTPQPIVEQQIAMNVNPEDVFSGGNTETNQADAITQIVNEQINQSNQITQQPTTNSDDIINLTTDPINNNQPEIKEPIENINNSIPVIENNTEQPQPIIEQQIPIPNTVQPPIEQPNISIEQNPNTIVEAVEEPKVEPQPIEQPVELQQEPEPMIKQQTIMQQPVIEENDVESPQPIPLPVEPIPEKKVEPVQTPIITSEEVEKPTPIIEETTEAVPNIQIEQPVENPSSFQQPVRPKTRFCDNCGEMITDSSTICPNCGTPLN